MCWPTKRFVLALLTAAAFLSLSHSICLADAGSPIGGWFGVILLGLVGGVTALAVSLFAITFIEAHIFKRGLQRSDSKNTFVGVGLANIVSAVVGTPLSGAMAYAVISLDGRWWGWVVLTLMSGMLVAFFVSVYVEYRLLKWYFDDVSPACVRRLTWVANTASYVFVIPVTILIALDVR